MTQQAPASAAPPTSATRPASASARRADKRSLFQLIADIPTLVTNLVKDEIAQLKVEMIAKLKALGIGGGIIAVAVVILLYMIGVLLTAAVLGLAEVMAPWLAALVVAAFLLIVAVIVGLIGYRVLKAGIPPVPQKTIASVKRDVATIKGMTK